MLAKLMTTASLLFLIPLSSFASDIRQRPFAYSFDAASAQNSDTFVVCSECPDSKLSILPAVAKLAVRMSSPEEKGQFIEGKVLVRKTAVTLTIGDCCLQVIRLNRPFLPGW